jgi:hypothetical protein
VNPFLRLYNDVQLHYVKMFVRVGLCNHVRTHGCDEGILVANGTALPRSMGSNRVRSLSFRPFPMRLGNALTGGQQFLFGLYSFNAMWQVAFDYYKYRGLNVMLIPPFSYSFDGAVFNHYYTKVRSSLSHIERLEPLPLVPVL